MGRRRRGSSGPRFNAARIPEWSPLEHGMQREGRVRVGQHRLQPGACGVVFRVGRQPRSAGLVLRAAAAERGMPGRCVVLVGGVEQLVLATEVLQVLRGDAVRSLLDGRAADGEQAHGEASAATPPALTGGCS